MDFNILKKHINSVPELVLPIIKEDGSNLSDFYCADVVGNRRFAQNYGGYPRSEIAEINAQASLQQAANLLNDLQVAEGSYMDSSLTPEEIMLSHRSKYIQAPSEMIDFIDRQLQIRDMKYGQTIASQNKEGTIKFDSQNSNADVNE
jgi:hypothetical protein